MKLYLVSILHMEPAIAAYSLMRGLDTIGCTFHDWILLDNHWPMVRPTSESMFFLNGDLARMVHGILLVAPEGKNLGGHGGFNFCLDFINNKWDLDPDDLVVIYDPDSNPVTPFWGKAMMEVMQADPTLGAVSLMINDILPNREWKIRTVAGHRLAQDDRPEMYNVTAFRASALSKGLVGASPFYGGIESMMFNAGMKQAYLYDFREANCPIPHPQVYIDWKYKHGYERSFLGNFDEYLLSLNLYPDYS